MSFWRTPLFAALVIVAAAAAAYHNTFWVPFLFDDRPSIEANRTIRSLRTAWSPPAGTGLTVSGRPLLNATLWLNFALSGTAVRSYHLVNLLIHLAAGCTLFGIVHRTLTRGAAKRDRRIPPPKGRGKALEADSTMPSYSTDATWIALTVALLWTLHPLQTQAVTYIVQRAESLVSLMYLLTLWCFIRSVEPGASRSWAWLTWVACLLGMAAKEVMVTAPVLVALYDRVFVAGSWKEVWERRRWRHLALATTWLLLLWLVVSTAGRGGTAGFGGKVSPWAYAVTQVGAVGHYLRLIFWPHPLVFDYGTHIATGWGEVWPAAVVIFPLLAASIWGAWRGKAAGFLGFVFFAVLAPSSSFVPVLTQTMGEHRVYLALAAVATLVVCGLYSRWGRRGLYVGVALAGGLGVATVIRNHDYRTEESIWADTAAKRPDNRRALLTLAQVYKAENRLDEAIPLLEQALVLSPDYVQAMNTLGLVWVRKNRPDRAVEYFRRSVTETPEQPMMLHNLGSALTDTNRFPEAIAAFEAGLRLKPDQAVSRAALAAVLFRSGRSAEAAEHYARYFQTEPGDAEEHGIYGNVLFALARPQEAFVQVATAIRLQPGNAELRNQLGEMLARSGRPAEATVQFQAALRLRPDYAVARENLERALQAAGGQR